MMPCPECGHTMCGIGNGQFHCPRCGTISLNDPMKTLVVPLLVERCREYERTTLTFNTVFSRNWRSICISESINTPEHRPKEF